MSADPEKARLEEEAATKGKVRSGWDENMSLDHISSALASMTADQRKKVLAEIKVEETVHIDTSRLRIVKVLNRSRE